MTTEQTAGGASGSINCNTETNEWIHQTVRSVDISFGLEMQHPWSRHLLEGRKTIEVRNYTLPEPMIGQAIYIMETQQGTDNKSSLCDEIHLSCEPRCQIIGRCTFADIKEYKSKKEFETDQARHLVSPTSGYAWKEGTTKILYGWIVQEVHMDSSTKQFVKAVRRKRSLFQLYCS